MGPLCRLFFTLSHGKVSLKFFLFCEKAEKTWGKTGQNWGRGDLFAVPIVHCNPSMVVDNKLLVINSNFVFFSL